VAATTVATWSSSGVTVKPHAGMTRLNIINVNKVFRNRLFINIFSCRVWIQSGFTGILTTLTAKRQPNGNRAMKPGKIRLFGPPQIDFEGESVLSQVPVKGLALLDYLFVHSA
jgi:hypothetical protein